MEDHQSSTGNRLSDSEPAMTMAQLLEQSYGIKAVQRGEIMMGTIVGITPHEILVDVGAKSEGIVAGREMEGLTPQDLAELHTGDEVPVYIVKPEDEEGHILLSLTRARAEKDWLTAQKLYDSGESYEGIVVGHNKGGLIVHFGQVRGFVPGSQLASNRGAGSPGKDDRWNHMVGQKLRLKIIEIDRRRNRLILSERAAMQEWRKERKEKLLGDLKEGDMLKGRVTSLADFGAFVDLGGADGLIHLSELSWSRVSHPRDILHVGDEIEVYVLNIDAERQRIGLSLKRLQPEPWSQVLGKYEIGQVVEATITKLANFGAFAQIDEIEGLIHLSELTDANITHPREVVKEGDRVSVKIIRIDPERRRIGLSLKQAAGEADWEEYQSTEGTDQEMAPEAVPEIATEMTPEVAPEV